MKQILLLKHWQVFILLVGIPAVFVFPMMAAAITMEDINKIFSFYAVIIISACTLVFLWFYSLGTNLHKRLPPDVKMNVGLFKIFLIFPTLYFIGLAIFMVNMFENLIGLNSVGPAVILLIMPLHAFSMFCYAYCFYFIAKTLRSVELQKPVTFGDFIGEFFLVWYYPVGVWFIQPRVNQIVKNEHA